MSEIVHLVTQKKITQRPNPLFIKPLSPLSPGTTVRLPSELHDYIIDHLHNDLRQTNLIYVQYGLQRLECIDQIPSFRELLATQRLKAYMGRLHLQQSHVLDEELSTDDVYPFDSFQFNHGLHHLTGLLSLNICSSAATSLFLQFVTTLARNFSSITDLEITHMDINSFAQFTKDIHEDDSPLALYKPSTLIDVLNVRANPLLADFQLCIHRLAIGMLDHEAGHTTLFSNIFGTLGPRLGPRALDNLRHQIHAPLVPDLSPATALHTFETLVSSAPAGSTSDGSRPSSRGSCPTSYEVSGLLLTSVDIRVWQQALDSLFLGMPAVRQSLIGDWHVPPTHLECEDPRNMHSVRLSGRQNGYGASTATRPLRASGCISVQPRIIKCREDLVAYPTSPSHNARPVNRVYQKYAGTGLDHVQLRTKEFLD
ncbi:hypothetical protein B0H19DRAFT_1058391 [Mycena capillaripes]|nr:hypothetical protein B0H19DRAFT_1058391 [Mycena capillaripes]